MPKFLVIGMSHIIALRNAALLEKDKSFEFINLNKYTNLLSKGQFDIDYDEIGKIEPNYLVFSLGGNLHNIFGIVENSVPFSIGHFSDYFEQEKLGRQLIPIYVMRDEFELQYKFLFSLSKKLCAIFSKSKIIYCNSPPPISQERLSYINQGPHFKEILNRGFAPKSLRLDLFRIQTDVVSTHAINQGAIFLDSPAEAIDNEGFLLESYCSNDFTHANLAYGQLVLKQLRKLKVDIE